MNTVRCQLASVNSTSALRVDRPVLAASLLRYHRLDW